MARGPGAVGGDVGAVAILEVSHVRDAFQQVPVTAQAHCELELGALPRGDVAQDDLAHGAALVDDGRRTALRIEHAAVQPDEFLFPQPGLLISRGSVLVHELGRNVADDLPRRAGAEQFQRSGVGEFDGVAAVYQRGVRRRFDERAVALFTEAQRLLDAFARADVAHHHVSRRRALIDDHRGAYFDVDDAAVQPHVACLAQARFVSRAMHVIDALAGDRLVVRMHEGQYRFADDLLGGIRTQQIECRAVRVVDLDVADDERGVGRRFDQLPEARLALGELLFHALSGADIANHDLAGGHAAVHDHADVHLDLDNAAVETDEPLFPQSRQRPVLHHALDALVDRRQIVNVDEIKRRAADDLVRRRCAEQFQRGRIRINDLVFPVDQHRIGRRCTERMVIPSAARRAGEQEEPPSRARGREARHPARQQVKAVVSHLQSRFAAASLTPPVGAVTPPLGAVTPPQCAASRSGRESECHSSGFGRARESYRHARAPGSRQQ